MIVAEAASYSQSLLLTFRDSACENDENLGAILYDWEDEAMTRLLVAGLVVVGVAFGVGVNADTPEQPRNVRTKEDFKKELDREFEEATRQRHKLLYLNIAERSADEWPLGTLQEETKRLRSELAQADDQEPRVQVEELEEAAEDRPRLRRRERDPVEEANERNRRLAQRRLQNEAIGRFQIVTREGGWLVLDTTTGEVWGGSDGKVTPSKLMTSVLDAPE